MTSVQVLGNICFVTAILGGIVCWFVAVVNMFLTLAHRKPGVPMFPNWWESPFNILFRPAQLTERGLAARRWCLFGAIGFLACWMRATVVGIATCIGQ